MDPARPFGQYRDRTTCIFVNSRPHIHEFTTPYSRIRHPVFTNTQLRHRHAPPGKPQNPIYAPGKPATNSIIAFWHQISHSTTGMHHAQPAYSPRLE